MAFTWQSLPIEVWINVLNRVKSVQQLAQCRLVCKMWDPLAEKAMFSQKMILYSNPSFIKKLHYHLATKPALNRHIRHLDLIRCSEENMTLLYKELFKMLITPDIETISGSIISPDVQDLFLQIVQDSPRQFKKIQQIATPTMNDSTYAKLLQTFKDSLQTMYIWQGPEKMNAVLDNLYLFPKLTNFYFIDYNLLNIKELDDTLKKLQCANHLKVRVGFASSNYRSKTKNEMYAWLNQHVQKDHHVEALLVHLSRDPKHDCNLVEYLAYKYPRLGVVDVLGLRADSNLERTMNALKHVPVLALTEGECMNPDHLWMIGYTTKSPTNNIRISYHSYMESNDPCKVDVIKSNEISLTDFEVSLSPSMPHTFIKQILSSVATGTSLITKLDVDLVHCKDFVAWHELLTFYDILEYSPRIRIMELYINKIKFKALNIKNSILRDLKSLEICGAEIDADVIPQISRLSPNLEHFTLASSIVLEETGDYHNRFHVIMPHSNLSSLTLKLKEHHWIPETGVYDRPEMKNLDYIESQMSMESMTYLHIKTEKSPENCYILTPNNNTIMAISKYEFNLHSRGSTVIYVECKSLSFLALNLSGICVDIAFENGKLHDETLVVESKYLKIQDKCMKAEQNNIELNKKNSALKHYMATKMSLSHTQIAEIEDDTS